MEKPPGRKEGEKGPPQKPKELEYKDTENIHNFFNNFPARIASRERLMNSDNAKSRQFGEAIELAIQETNFDIKRFAELHTQIRELGHKWADAFNSRSPNLDSITDEVETKAIPLQKELNQLIFPLYQHLRKAGLSHSDLVS